MSGALLAPAAQQAVTDLTPASTVYTHAIEGAVDALRSAGLVDEAKTVERIRELHRLHHAQLDALAARLLSNMEML